MACRLFVVLSFLLLPIISFAQNDDTNRFGIVEGFWLPDLACDLGVGWERIIFNWAEHQPTASDDWHTLNVDDRWLKSADSCDREVVALLKHTPAWATDGTEGIGVPRGLSLPINDTGNLWANFVQRAVDYYASRGVNRFIIWNEPDITSDTYGYEFEGSIDDYYLLLKVAYLVAKETNPSVEIHLAGTTYWHDVDNGRRLYVDRLMERIQQDPDAVTHHHYFDVLSLHIYFRTDSIYDIVNEMQTILDRYGLQDKTIWINEMNAPPTADPAWLVDRPNFQLNLEQQAAFIMQATALALAADVERVAVYKLYDQDLPPSSETFGLVTPSDASPRPAYAVWQNIVAAFNDVQGAKLARTDRVDVVILEHRNERQTLVAWARTEHTVELSISVSNPKAYLSDLYGKLAIVRPENGAIRMILPGALCNNVDGCPVGGIPWLLVLPPGELSIQEVTSNGTQTLDFD